MRRLVLCLFRAGMPRRGLRLALGKAAPAAAALQKWRPVLLRWRQRRKRIADAPPVGRPVHTTNIASFHQLHLHPSAVLSDRLLRERTSSSFTRHAREVLRYERGVDRSNTIVRTLPGRVDRRVIHESRATFARITSPASPASSPGSSPSSSRTVSMTSLVPRHEAAKPSRSTPINRVREERTIATQAHAQFRSQWLQTISRRTQTVADSVTRTAHHSKTIRGRTQELVWRRVMKTDTSAPEQETTPQVASQRSVARTLRESTSVERSAAPPVTRLDPILMDRLAEDVIRRVEQRIRIERERRGL